MRVATSEEQRELTDNGKVIAEPFLDRLENVRWKFQTETVPKLNAVLRPYEIRKCQGHYSKGRATRKPMTLSRLPLGKLMRAEGLANSAS
jgi:hypothetical protein